MLRIGIALALVVTFASPDVGQVLSATVTPNPAAIGESIVLHLTVASEHPVTFIDSCIIRQMNSGSPDGPIVWEPRACQDVATMVLPGYAIEDSSEMIDLDGQVLGPGTYWMLVMYLNHANGQLEAQRFGVTVMNDDRPGPSLRALVPAEIGGDLPLALEALSFQWGSYIVAASFTTNRGFNLGPGMHVGLDQDALFALSVPVPEPSLFLNFQGSLDEHGNAYGALVHIPGLPQLVGAGFNLQAVVWDPSGPFDPPGITNPLAITIGW